MNSMTKVAIAAATAIIAQTSVSQAATIGTYAFTNQTDFPTATGVTFGQFTRTGLGSASTTGAFSSNGFSTDASIDTTEYVQFQVTALSGYQLTGTSLSYTHDRDNQGPGNSKTGPQSGAIRYSANSFSSSGQGTFTPADSATSDSWNFTDFTVANGQSVSFRFYGWAAKGTEAGNKLNLDNVALLGDVQALARLNASSTSLPARIIKDAAASYTITTTNTANSGGTIAAQTLNFDYGLQSAVGLSITSGETATGIRRNGDGSPTSADTTVTVDTSSAGTRSGSLKVDSTNAFETASPLPSFSVDVLDHSNGTLRHGADIGDTLDLTLNALVGQTVSEEIAIQNIIANALLGADFTAKLDYIGISETDAGDVFSNTLTDFGLLAAGEEALFSIGLDTTSQGTFTGQYLITVRDEALSGMGGVQTLTINLTASVVPEPACLSLLGLSGLALIARRKKA
jgi:hypothetical protein